MVKYDSKTLRVNADFFLNTEKKISVFESTRLRVDEALVITNETKQVLLTKINLCLLFQVTDELFRP